MIGYICRLVRALPLPKKLHLAVDGNYKRDLQLSNIRTIRGLGTLSPKRDVFIKYLPQG